MIYFEPDDGKPHMQHSDVELYTAAFQIYIDKLHADPDYQLSEEDKREILGLRLEIRDIFHFPSLLSHSFPDPFQVDQAKKDRREFLQQFDENMPARKPTSMTTAYKDEPQYQL